MASTAETAADDHPKSKTLPHTRQVKITYAFPGTRPPIYLAGSFTTPPWEPQEMEFTPKEASQPGEDAPMEYDFFRVFQIEEGQWQYKFRIGDADWWALDEEAPISTDELGNRNNLLVVKRERTAFATEHTSVETRTPLPIDETVEPELFPTHTAHTNGKEEQETAADMNLPTLESSGDAELSKSQSKEHSSPLPVKLSEPDIIPPQEELTVLKERDKVVPQEVEDKTNLVLPGHENKGGELVGVKKADAGSEENASHKPAVEEDKRSPGTTDTVEADEELPDMRREPTTQDDETPEKAVDHPRIEAVIPGFQKETMGDAGRITEHHEPADSSNHIESHAHASNTATPVKYTEDDELDPHASPEKTTDVKGPEPHKTPEVLVLADGPDASAEEAKSTPEPEGHFATEESSLVPEVMPEVASEKAVPVQEKPELHTATEEPTSVPEPEPEAASEKSGPAQEPESHAATEEQTLAKEPGLNAAIAEPTLAKEPESNTAAEEPTLAKEQEPIAATEEPTLAKESEANAATEESTLAKEQESHAAAEEPTLAKEQESITATEEPTLAKESESNAAAEGPMLAKEPELHTASEEPALVHPLEKLDTPEEPVSAAEGLTPEQEPVSHTTSQELPLLQEPQLLPTAEELAPAQGLPLHHTSEEPMPAEEPNAVPAAEVLAPEEEPALNAVAEERVLEHVSEPLPTAEELARPTEELAPPAETVASVQEPALPTPAEEVMPVQESEPLPTEEELAPVPDSTSHESAEKPIPVPAVEQDSIPEDPVLVRAPELQAASEESTHTQELKADTISVEPVVIQTPEPDATPVEPVIEQEPGLDTVSDKPAPVSEPERLAIPEGPILSKDSDRHSSSEDPATLQEPEPLAAFGEPFIGPEHAAEPHNVELSAPVPDLATEEIAPGNEPTSKSPEDIPKDKEPQHAGEDLLESTGEQPQGEPFTGPVETQFVNAGDLTEAHEQTAKAPLSPSFKEQKGKTSTPEDEPFPIRPVEEHIDGSTDVYHSLNELTQTDAPADAKEHNITEEIPIPFTVVEKVQGIERPVYGDSADDQSSLHEIVEKRQADAEPDQVVEPEKSPAIEEGKAAEASDSLPIPTLVVEKTDEGPRHGDDFGPEGTQAQKLAHEKRAADAEPDEIIISPEHEAERHEVKGEIEATEKLPEPEPLSEDVEHLTPRSGTEPPNMEPNAHLPDTEGNPELAENPEEPSVELGQKDEESIKNSGDEKDDGVQASTGSAVPEAVEQNQKEAGDLPGPSSPPAGKPADAEEELVAEAPTTPSTAGDASHEKDIDEIHPDNESSGGPSVGEIALGATGLAGAVALVKHAVAKSGKSGQEYTGSKPAEKEDLSDAPKADEVPNGTEITTEKTSGVPDVVRDSISEAHSEPKAAANPKAVHAKEAVEQELLEEVQPVEELGEPAPTITAPLIESAPAPLQEAVTSEMEKSDAPARLGEKEDLGVDYATESDVLEGSKTSVVNETSSTPVLGNTAQPVTPVDKPSTPIPEIIETPETADAAPEVIDSATLLSKPSMPIPEIKETVADAAEAAPLLDEPSTPIPEVAETAAEGADSVAILDKPSTPIPEIVETAAEVADSATLLDKPSTPIPKIAETAAEVADSAALLDKPSTPIPEIAETAAEVADSTALLDKASTQTSKVEAAETTEAAAEVADSAALLDKPSTPIPEIAETAAEVADSAAILDKPSTPIPEAAETAAETTTEAAPLLDKPSTPIPEIAETAAEVADSAALLDKPSTPIPDITETPADATEAAPLRDEPSTPIPDIAETAAEVADSAALLDKPSTPIPEIEAAETTEAAGEVVDSAALLDKPSIPLPGARAIASEDAFRAAVGHNAEFDSPRVEDAPLFAHECLGLYEGQPTAPDDQSQPSPALGNETSQEPEEPTADDLADPMLEPFPSEREHVLERLRSTEARLVEDETSVEGIPPSPILNPSKQSHDFAPGRSPSPLLERSPVLDAIPEESAPSSTSKSALLPEAAEEKLDNDDSTAAIVAAGTAAVVAGVIGAAIAHESSNPSDKEDSQDHFASPSSVNAALPVASLPAEKELPVGTTIDVHERSLTPLPAMEQTTDGVQDMPTIDSAPTMSSSTVAHPSTLTEEKSLEPPPTSISSQAAPSSVELEEVDKALEEVDLDQSPSDTKDQSQVKNDSDHQVPSVENAEVYEPPMSSVGPKESGKALKEAELEPSPSTHTKEPLKVMDNLNLQVPSPKDFGDQEPAVLSKDAETEPHPASKQSVTILEQEQHAAPEEAEYDPDHEVPSIKNVEVREPTVPAVEPEEVDKALEEAELEPTPAHTEDPLEVEDELDHEAPPIKAAEDQGPSVLFKHDETELPAASKQPVTVHEQESHTAPGEPKVVQEPEPLTTSDEAAPAQKPEPRDEEPPLSVQEQSQETHDQEVTDPVAEVEDGTREATQESDPVGRKEDGISGKAIVGAVAGVGALVGGAALVRSGAPADVSSGKAPTSNADSEGTPKALDGPGDGDFETVPHEKPVGKDTQGGNEAASTIPAVVTTASSDVTSNPPVSSAHDTVGEGSSTKQGKANGTSVSVEEPAEGGLRQRKVAPDTPERPRTPHSVQSLKGPKHTNIFKTFWHTVFGGWVGGFFSKIFGKRNRA